MRLTQGVGVLADFHWQKGQNDPLIDCFSLCVRACVCVYRCTSQKQAGVIRYKSQR